MDKYDLLDKMNKEFLQVYKTILVERLEGDNSFALEKLEKIYFIKVIRHIWKNIVWKFWACLRLTLVEFA